MGSFKEIGTELAGRTEREANFSKQVPYVQEIRAAGPLKQDQSECVGASAFSVLVSRDRETTSQSSMKRIAGVESRGIKASHQRTDLWGACTFIDPDGYRSDGRPYLARRSQLAANNP